MSDRLKELSARIADGTQVDNSNSNSTEALRPNYLVRIPSFMDNEIFTNPGTPKQHSTGNNSSRMSTDDTGGGYQGMVDPSVDGFSIVKGRCETAIVRMRESFNTAIDRGQQLDAILNKSDDFHQTTEQFHNQSRALDSQQSWRRWIVPIVTGSIVIVLMTILCFLNRFVFWLLIAFMGLALLSVVYFYAHKRHVQLHSSMPSEVAMSII